MDDSKVVELLDRIMGVSELSLNRRGQLLALIRHCEHITPDEQGYQKIFYGAIEDRFQINQQSMSDAIKAFEQLGLLTLRSSKDSQTNMSRTWVKSTPGVSDGLIPPLAASNWGGKRMKNATSYGSDNLDP